VVDFTLEKMRGRDGEERRRAASWLYVRTYVLVARTTPLLGLESIGYHTRVVLVGKIISIVSLPYGGPAARKHAGDSSWMEREEKNNKSTYATIEYVSPHARLLYRSSLIGKSSKQTLNL
jgi:hypothetical protein